MSLIRRILTFAIVIATLLCFAAIYYNQLSLFRAPQKEEDIATALFYLLSTLVQTLGAITGIAVALLFLTAQFVSRPGTSRLLREVYWGPTGVLTMACFFSAISVGVLTLARVSILLENHDYRWADVNIVLAIATIALLCPLVLLQFENINPYAVARRLARRITVGRICAYGLAHVCTELTPPGRIRYAIRRWRLDHGHDDPLGGFHEVVMQAVDAHDRVLLSLLVRLLLSRIAVVNAVPYQLVSTPRLNVAPRHLMYCWLYTHFRRPRSDSNRVAVTLHILHYIVRRARNMVAEWKGRDVVRQAFVRDIIDLIETLRLRDSTNQIIVLAEFAILHICLSYTTVPRYGRIEPLAALYVTATNLYENGRVNEATLCTEILAVIAVRTGQLPPSARLEFEKELSPGHLVDVYRSAMSRAIAEVDWLPGNVEEDPWRGDSTQAATQPPTSI